ncbi:hypothetical protein BKN38_08215 [Helicobacter sp. CLO-3]|uniref:hypothetical protein n=1 Tax=unclassified Helicobacter TaxID=2593540 RepID=UPI00080489DB|nr:MULTISPECIES: hypothetical protein [unclassified Helicobacter]OBV30078.1 hypothetical protein BA723_09880 [Helicobacter sp. CLO-3]OHU81868.1 hypothetical protein BKN38_08215 [Helicobacter sp. CLO-3]
MKKSFKWGKFMLDCFICLYIAIISPFIYSYLIKSDDLRWILFPIKWLTYPIEWILYPIECIFNINPHTISDIAILIVGFFSLSIIAFSIINIFYKIHRASLILCFIFMTGYAAFGYYFFSHL